MIKKKMSLYYLNSEARRIKNAGKIHWFHWLIIASSLLLTLGTWHFSYSQVQQKAISQFNRQTSNVLELITEQMKKYEDALWSGVATIHSQSHGIDYYEWKRFADTLQLEKRHPGINGIGIIYQVKPLNRAEFLRQERQLQPEFTIFPSHNHNTLLPITYIEPNATNIEAIGMDIAHEPKRYLAAQKARNTAKPQMTAPIQLVQDAEKKAGALLFTPFYQKQNNQIVTPKTIDGRQENFVGMVYAPFIVKNFMYGTLDKEKRDIQIRIQDNESTLYNEIIEDQENHDPNPAFTTTKRLELYGRNWDFYIQTTTSFKAQAKNYQPAIILIAGIAIDTLLFIFFLLLAKSNRQAIRFSESMMEQYKIKADELKNSNVDLEEFTFRVSHDLRSPLTSASNLLDTSDNSIKNNEKEKTLICNKNAKRALNTSIRLIEKILTLTKITHSQESNTIINIESIMLSAIEDNKLEENDVKIYKNFCFSEDLISKPEKISIIADNIISNAMKYKNADKKDSFIKISTYKDSNRFVLEVEDNGIKIPPQYHGKIFSMFTRFHPELAEGTGLGLYIAQKSAKAIDGKIYFIEKNNGNLFKLELPLLEKNNSEMDDTLENIKNQLKPQ